jgi:hypothetical protein
MISFIIASPPLRNVFTNMSMLGHRGKDCRPKGRDRPAKKAKTERRRLSSQRPRKRKDTKPAGVREPKIWCEVSFLLTHEFLYFDQQISTFTDLTDMPRYTGDTPTHASTANPHTARIRDPVAHLIESCDWGKQEGWGLFVGGFRLYRQLQIQPRSQDSRTLMATR